ncbi:uncharacterized protein LOC141777188 isoform X2 [Sebastes fasciatus]|uniref:uncharacterized protein LOC141777188 isoform X2 n=1 Tax=Sebastes fasciatus TaxID=394691 RepID=UPI003D9DC415
MHDTMMRKGKRKSATVYLAAALILACYLAQTIDCYRLKKTERREGRKEAAAARTRGVQEGEIVFGRAYVKGSGLESPAADGTKDEAAYQADFAGWSKGQTQDTSSREAFWKRMATSLQCGGNQLKFRAVGPGASQFAVEQGNAPPVPLAQVPSTCGYNMQRNPLGLVMLVPFDGCNIVQEGGSYVLPMRWQGIPVSLWCPKPAAPALTTAAPVPETSQAPVPEPTTNTKKPGIPQLPQYPFFPPFYPYFRPPFPVTTAAPTTTTNPTTTTTAKPAVGKPAAPSAAPSAAPAPPSAVPFPFYPPFYPPFPWPGPSPAAAKPMPKPQPPQFPPYMPFYPPYHPLPQFLPPYPQYPTPKPITTTTPTTTKTTTTTKPKPQPPQFPPYMPFYPPYHLPQFFPPYPQYPTPKPKTTTTPTTTTTKPKPQPLQFPPYMPFYNPYQLYNYRDFIPPYPQYPTPKPKTTTTPATTTTTVKPDHPPPPPQHQQHHPHFHPQLRYPFMPIPPPRG